MNASDLYRRLAGLQRAILGADLVSTVKAALALEHCRGFCEARAPLEVELTDACTAAVEEMLVLLSATVKEAHR